MGEGLNHLEKNSGRRLLRWHDVYREAELYKSAVRVYTKPLFQWRKALNTSTDGGTLYDLAARGLRGLDRVHRTLAREEFEFRPSAGLKYNFNGKRRTLYIPPWEERIVDLLLYRALNRRLHSWFSADSYAYRDSGQGLDACQSRIARSLREIHGPVYLVKRDISDYFGSIDHDILLKQLARHVHPGDYLFRLLEQRIRFAFVDETGSHIAAVGVPFGCASACVFANVYLTELDRAVASVPNVRYFRYADDLLVLSPSRESALQANDCLRAALSSLKLGTKASHEMDFVLGEMAVQDSSFADARNFRHLGLQFGASGDVTLSRDKRRKIQNLFRFAFRRRRRAWRRIGEPLERARTLAAIAAETIDRGIRNVAIVDYYLKHVTAEEQLASIDRWLAEEILSLVFGGHKKGHFGKISFARLREMGLPSLVHRRREILHGKRDSPFFVWRENKRARALKGTVARLVRASGEEELSLRARKQQPEMPVREGGCL